MRGWKHQSQASLAAQLIADIQVASGSPVVVVGDTAFEAKQVRKACSKRDWRWVVPLNPERVLAGAKPRPKVSSLYKQLSASDFSKVSFRLDEGEHAALARVSPSRSKSSKHGRTYWVHHRTADILNIGRVALLFSTQTDPTTPAGVKVQKLLISDALAATPAQILFWYSLRWQIEIHHPDCPPRIGLYRYGRVA
jgi:hypothetical protein